MGNRKRILCSNWLPEQARSTHLPNRDCSRKKKFLRGFTMFVILGQCHQWSLKEWQMTVRTKRRWASFMNLLLCHKNLKYQSNMSLSILTKAIHVRYMINPWFIQLVCFSCFCHSKYHKSITAPLQCGFFDGVYFFLWTSTLSIYLLPADIWEESSPHR